jgi:hypothetical protein
MREQPTEKFRDEALGEIDESHLTCGDIVRLR